MEYIEKMFRGYPSQEKVVAALLKSGIRVIDGVAYCNDIELSDSAIGRAVNVDRRVVRSTLERIDSIPKLKQIFSKMISIALLSDVSDEMDCTTIEIVPENARVPGIMSEICAVVYRAGISIKQAVVVNTGYNSDEQHLVMVLDGRFPPEYLPRIRGCMGVKSIILR